MTGKLSALASGADTAITKPLTRATSQAPRKAVLQGDPLPPAAPEAGASPGAGLTLTVEYLDVDINLIDVPDDRLRGADADWAEVIGASMDNSGQLQPIRVARKGDGRFELDFGLHRLAGARLKNWRTIAAGVISADALNRHQRRRTEIFENLIRNELGALQRALNLCEWKIVHEALYPEAKKGGNRGNQHVGGKKRQTEIISFSQEAAEKTGLSERAIEISVSIARGIGHDIRARLVGTWLANHQAGLRLLSEQSAEMQGRIVDLLFADPPQAASVPDALLLAQGKRLSSPSEKLFKSMAGGLVRLSKQQRSTLFEQFEDEIIADLKKRKRI
jgi:ParB family chromosome partitioning protein